MILKFSSYYTILHVSIPMQNSVPIAIPSPYMQRNIVLCSASACSFFSHTGTPDEKAGRAPSFQGHVADYFKAPGILLFWCSLVFSRSNLHFPSNYLNTFSFLTHNDSLTVLSATRCGGIGISSSNVFQCKISALNSSRSFPDCIQIKFIVF